MSRSPGASSTEPGGRAVGPWRTVSRERAFDCRIFTIDRVERRSPADDRSGTFFVIDSADWVNVLAITDREEIVMIRQYRHGTDQVTLEIPGGILDEGESPTVAAARELLEETGYAGGEARVIGRVAANPAFLDNHVYSVLITGCRRSGRTKFDEHEEIDVELRPVAEMEEMLLSGEMSHAYVALAFLWYRLHRQGHVYRGQAE